MCAQVHTFTNDHWEVKALCVTFLIIFTICGCLAAWVQVQLLREDNRDRVEYYDLEHQKKKIE